MKDDVRLRRRAESAAKLARAHHWPGPVAFMCLAVVPRRGVPATVAMTFDAVFTIFGVPGVPQWLARRGRVVRLGYAPGYAAAIYPYVVPFRKATVLRWEAVDPSFDVLRRGRFDLLYVPVSIDGRKLYVDAADAELLERALGG